MRVGWTEDYREVVVMKVVACIKWRKMWEPLVFIFIKQCPDTSDVTLLCSGSFKVVTRYHRCNFNLWW